MTNGVGGNGHRPRHPSTRDLADLARAGFEIARQTLMTVDFEIHHLTDRPADLAALLPQPPEDPEAPVNGSAAWQPNFLETMTSSANGVGVVIGTRTRGLRERIDTAGLRDGRSNVVVPTVSAGRWVFRQSASPNPTFIYESAQTYEGLIAVDPDATELQNWHGIALRDLTSELCEVAASVAQAPLLSLQSPAQLPPATRTRDHDLRTRKEALPPAPSSIAVRFSIALQEANAELFFTLSDRIRLLCEENGYGLWLADSRPGHRSGNWFEVCKPDDPGRHHRGDERGTAAVTTCVPITCVGPARVGSTYAIVSFLRRYPQVGLASCADCTLDDLALVHLQVALQGVPVERLNKIVANMSRSRSPSVSTRPREALEELFRRLDVPSVAPLGGHDDLASRAGDYQTFIGPAFDYRPRRSANRLPVWISWQIARKDDGLAAPLSCLYRALDHVVPNACPDDWNPVPLSTVTDVEYLICRATEQSVLRGKGKLSVPMDVLDRFEGTDIEAPASKFCLRLEEDWKMQMDLAEVTGVGELTVAWREYWLGHWTYT